MESKTLVGGISIIAGIVVPVVAEEKRLFSEKTFLGYAHVFSELIMPHRRICLFENDGRFYTSNNPDYIEAFKHKSPLFPDNAIHFLIVGTNTIIDVLAKEYPIVKVMD